MKTNEQANCFEFLSINVISCCADKAIINKQDLLNLILCVSINMR